MDANQSNPVAQMMIELPRYQSHKIVHALKIKSILFDSMAAKFINRETDGSAMITPEDDRYMSLPMPSSKVLTLMRQGIVIPASPLALDENRRLDVKHQRALYRYYAQAGAGGLLSEYTQPNLRFGILNLIYSTLFCSFHPGQLMNVSDIIKEQ